MDHLDGVLILDRAPRDQRKAALRALREGEAYAPEREPVAGDDAPGDESGTGSRDDGVGRQAG
jgi:hypothetical protein